MKGNVDRSAKRKIQSQGTQEERSRGNEKELMSERIGKGIDLRRNWMVRAIRKLFNLRLESADSRKTRVGRKKIV
jgi:5'-deoxynucleotidase YfbR-like HD superfamily hydrolase